MVWVVVLRTILSNHSIEENTSFDLHSVLGSDGLVHSSSSLFCTYWRYLDHSVVFRIYIWFTFLQVFNSIMDTLFLFLVLHYSFFQYCRNILWNKSSIQTSDCWNSIIIYPCSDNHYRMDNMVYCCWRSFQLLYVVHYIYSVPKPSICVLEKYQGSYKQKEDRNISWPDPMSLL